MCKVFQGFRLCHVLAIPQPLPQARAGSHIEMTPIISRLGLWSLHFKSYLFIHCFAHMLLILALILPLNWPLILLDLVICYAFFFFLTLLSTWAWWKQQWIYNVPFCCVLGEKWELPHGTWVPGVLVQLHPLRDSGCWPLHLILLFCVLRDAPLQVTWPRLAETHWLVHIKMYMEATWLS